MYLLHCLVLHLSFQKLKTKTASNTSTSRILQKRLDDCETVPELFFLRSGKASAKLQLSDSKTDVKLNYDQQ
jgi:hypothetical protein